MIGSVPKGRLWRRFKKDGTDLSQVGCVESNVWEAGFPSHPGWGVRGRSGRVAFRQGVFSGQIAWAGGRL
jgi:hypothetical protein